MKLLLPAKALHVDDREAEHLDLRERFLDGFEFRGLDDGENELHETVPLRARVLGIRHEFDRFEIAVKCRGEEFEATSNAQELLDYRYSCKSHECWPLPE